MSAMPAEAEPRRASVALRPTTVRPRQASLRVLPAPAEPGRPAGERPGLAGPRAHLSGVAGSAALRADWPSAAPSAPQARPSRLADDSPSLRLTRRGRVVLAVLAAAVASLLGLAVASSAQAADHGAATVGAGHSMSRIVVQPGQTLWSIAVQADPQADPRIVVQHIIEVNALPGSSVTAGQRLLVPPG